MTSPTASTGSTADAGAADRDRLLLVWEGGARSITLEPGRNVLVGRSRRADLSVDDPSLSREHATFWLGEAGVCVADAGSRNGVFVDGVKVPRGQHGTLPRGGIARLGDVLAVHQPRLREAEPTPASSTAWREMNRLLPLVAKGTISVLVLGETGAGKEVTARAIHRLSPRAKAPFVTLHCAALPESLLEAELFGYERGAFTGATSAKPGLLESAEGGTAFLDEITEIEPPTQAKLLRVVETKSITRLGALRPRSVDVRFVAATNRDVHELVGAGRFREDLYYRLAGVTLHVPPLRSRVGEIAKLTDEFAREASRALGGGVPTFEPGARACLERYPWPGNVRELRNAIEAAVLLAAGGPIGVAHLPPRVAGLGAAPADPRRQRPARPLHAEIHEIEKARILDTLERTGGNQSRAARELGISRRLLLERLDAYGTPRPRKPPGPQLGGGS